MASLVLKRAFSRAASPHPVGVLGVPMWKGQKKPGTDIAPGTLRNESCLFAGVENVIGHSLKDYGDLDLSSCGPENDSSSRFMGAASRLIRESVHRCLEECSQLLTLGGDHSMAIGTVTGHADYAQKLGK